jgi:multidrug resistance protein, MATE family
MVPLGLSTGAAVRCGQALGAGDPEAVNRAGTTALLNGVVYAAISASLLVAFAEPVARLYRVTDDVMDLAVVFLGVAALFQLVDCLQVLGNGVLRGLGDTRLPLAFTLLGYGILGIPLGWLGAFRLTDDPIWLWYGLTIGLTIVAGLAILRFRWQIRRLRAELGGAPGRQRPPLA